MGITWYYVFFHTIRNPKDKQVGDQGCNLERRKETKKSHEQSDFNLIKNVV